MLWYCGAVTRYILLVFVTFIIYIAIIIIITIIIFIIIIIIIFIIIIIIIIILLLLSLLLCYLYLFLHRSSSRFCSPTTATYIVSWLLLFALICSYMEIVLFF